MRAISQGPVDLPATLMSGPTFDHLDRLSDFARQRGKTLLELAFAWLLGLPGVVSVIAGATSPDQVAANAAAARWTLTEEEMRELETLAPADPGPAAN